MRRCLPIAMLALVALLAGCTDDEKTASGPVVTAAATPEEGPAPLTVGFATEVVFGDVADFSYRWDFGDGEQSTSAEPSHTYAEEGLYRVTVEVTDNEGGATGSDRIMVDVGAPDPNVQTTEPTDTGSGEEPVAFDDWVEEVNAACAATVDAAEGIQPAEGSITLTDEQWGQLADLQRTETEAIDEAGRPDARTDEVAEWLTTRAEGADLFIEITEATPVDPLDERWAQVDSIGQRLLDLSFQLGLGECTGE